MSLLASEVMVGQEVGAELGDSVVLSIKETLYRHSGKPARVIRFRLTGSNCEYTRLYALDTAITTAEDAPFRRWLEEKI